MDTYHPSRLKPETIFRDIMNRSTNRLDQESSDSVRIQTGLYMIKSGLPHLIRQGRGIVRRIRTRQFINKLKSLKHLSVELDAAGAALLAERRTKFIQQIEEKRNDETNRSQSDY